MTVSTEYRKMLEDMHRAAPWGVKGAHYADDVRAFAVDLGARSILDYGCGQQTLAAALAGSDVRGYDPGIPELAARPAPADLVVTTDVLEHVEPERLADTIDEIFDLAQIGVYHAIALTPAKRFLPDGRNAHLTIQPDMWWLGKIGFRPGWQVVKHVPGRKLLKVWLKRNF